ncbi:hypothetical protein SteCoe_24118 [Stentor coeruleus]|uniref:Uncharacterized protein n=1 Tax=Stentor coeruleus TaxID=5963 RepID=A0A1R2BI93_9CILI|nr:hypothetical protein SteCoe_24118 [Stentor coeruleus]
MVKAPIMFDYKYGTSTSKFKENLTKMLPKLEISPNPQSKSLSFAFKFIHGLEVLNLALVSKKFYYASWDVTLWHDLSYDLDESNLENQLNKAIYNLDIFSKKHPIFQNFSGAIKWRIVYITLLYKFCSYCKKSEQRLRFLPVLQRTLCFKCAKLQEYSMISLESALLDYQVKTEDIEKNQLVGLKVPHTRKSGKKMLVYYRKDIINISKTGIKKKENFKIRTNIEEKRRTEMIYYMQKEGIEENFISSYLNNEYTYCYSYIVGKSQQSARKIAKTMSKIYIREKKKKEKIIEIVDDVNEKTIKKAKISENDILQRKLALFERLTLMGLNTDDADFGGENGLFNLYVTGQTTHGLGYIAGEIWKESRYLLEKYKSKTD